MVSFRYKSTNCFLVKSETDDRILAIDAGWPCTLYEYAKALKSTGYRFDQIAWAIVTHFHLDHAGLIGEFQANGIRCLAFENQGLAAIDQMETVIFAKYHDYRPIDRPKLEYIDTARSKDFFASLGIQGEVIMTPGHSPDSISFLGTGQEVIIGDLSSIDQILPSDTISLRSWELIKANRGRYIFPSHAEGFSI